ncbi:MAG: acyl-CoA dehydrogenase [Acidobacteria bacterium RBG_16_68_9]|nr:MAG: acyl-CoA dehydrogenase [Acidobacteria bacterium RBG_16_68_9]
MPFPPFTSEHAQFRESVRAFAEREIAPNSEAWEREQSFPRDVFSKAGALGLLGVRFDPAYGGSGLDYWYTGILIEELMRGRNVGVVVSLMVQCEIATSIIHAYGSEELKHEWLVPAITGQRIAALGVTEPGAGSNVAGLRTTARRDGDFYVVNGSKIFITNGTIADFVTLAVRTGEPGARGVSVLIVPTDTTGFSVGRKLRKVMAHASDTAELFFEDCRVPAGNLVGEEGHGFYNIMRLFQGERLVLSYISNSWMREILDETLTYAGEREVFGSTLASMPVWRHRLADLMTQLEASRTLTWYATELMCAGDPAAEVTVSMAKLFAGELFKRLAPECDQVFGGYGCMEEYFVARATGGISGFAIGAGTSEVMREIIARRQIGK